MSPYEFIRDKELVNVIRDGDWVCSLSYSHEHKDWAMHTLGDTYELDSYALLCILNKIDELNREPEELTKNV